MRIVRHYNRVPQAAQGAVVALGNFDGVHRGHRKVIAAARRVAAAEGAPAGVLTFDPHPRRFFRPDEPDFELTPLPSKIRQVRFLGVEVLFLMRFDADFARKSADAFVTEVLVDGLHARHVVAGYDFVFGHRREGDLDLLRRLGKARGVGVEVVEAVTEIDGSACSSTTIRRHVAEGRPAAAAALLGRCWEIEGVVQTGDKRGREIGFPTANLDPAGYLKPALGVYAVWAGLEQDGETAWHAGVANIGRRPTFDGDAVTLEVYIFDFAGDIYGRLLRVALVEFLRPERRFDGLPAIRAQIAEDCERARAVIAALAADDPRRPPGGAEATS